MKKIAIALTALAAITSTASAADMAARPYTKAAPMVAAMYDWSGFYIGMNGGGGWSRKCWDLNAAGLATFTPAVAEGCHDATGGTVGGQVGYRWQSAAWVFGLEAQGNWADFKSSNVSLFVGAPGVRNNTKVDSFGLFTGQVGYSWNTFLLYVKGGAAVARDKYNGSLNQPVGPFPVGLVFDSASETRWGGVVGIGGEFAFSPNWSLAIEYDHAFLGNRDINFTATGANGVPIGTFSRNDRIRQDLDIVTARLNYRFGGPVIAKY